MTMGARETAKAQGCDQGRRLPVAMRDRGTTGARLRVLRPRRQAILVVARRRR